MHIAGTHKTLKHIEKNERRSRRDIEKGSKPCLRGKKLFFKVENEGRKEKEKKKQKPSLALEERGSKLSSVIWFGRRRRVEEEPVLQ